MAKPLAFFIGSVALSAVMAIPFAGFHRYEEREYAKLVEACAKGNEQHSPSKDGYVWLDTCDFHEVLKSPPSARSPVEQRIVNEHPSLKMHTMDVYLWSVAAVLFVGALPGVWYFLLRRLSEVSRAFRGL